MKSLYILLIALFGITGANAQPCLPEGITFNTQADIDNFQANYPGCTEIQGFVSIYGGQNPITSLAGLSVITSVGDYLTIYDTDILSLQGLNALVNVGGSLEISECNNLSDLTGLENLISVAGNFTIAYNENIQDFSGIISLQSVGADLNIFSNNSLVNFNALSCLSTVAGNIDIHANPALINLEGLSGLSSIQAGLAVVDNDQLNSLSALSNFTSVGGFLTINQNPALTSLAGLENLTTVGGNFQLCVNPSITNVDPLSSLTSVGGTFAVTTNGSLISLTGFSSLTQISGDLMIDYNSQLTSLIGLENINPNSIINLLLENNAQLSECDVLSICEYLTDPNGQAWIYGNANGCNSAGQIEDACNVGVKEETMVNRIQIIPNPSSGSITLLYSYVIVKSMVKIFTANGDKVLEKELDHNETQLDISALPRGVYFVRMQDEKMIEVMKLIKQ